MPRMAEIRVKVVIGLGGLDHCRVDVDKLSAPGTQFQGKIVETLNQCHARARAAQLAIGPPRPTRTKAMTR